MASAITWAATSLAKWATAAAINLVGPTTAIGGSLTFAKIVYGISYTAVTLGAYAGLAMATRPSMPDSEQAIPLNASDPYAQWGYGRARISGKRMFWESFTHGSAEVLAIHQGKIGGVVYRYLHDDQVTLTGNTVNTTDDGAYEFGAVKIYTNLGEATETNFAAISALSGPRHPLTGEPIAGDPLWSEDARLDGVHSVGLIFEPVKDKHVLQVYANGPPAYSEVADLSLVYDWRKDSTAVIVPADGETPAVMGDGPQRRDDETTWAWSDNPVICRIHNDWYRYGESWQRRFAPSIAANTEAADTCDELVAKADGDSEKRYRCGFVITAENHKADARAKFMACCDGRQYERADGAWVIRVGKYAAPTFTLTGRHVVEVSGTRGLTRDQAVDEIGFSYSSPDHGYTVQPGAPWVINADAPAGARRKTVVDLTGVNSHSQGRRLVGRLAVRRLSPRRWRITTDAYGRHGLGERWIRLQLPELGAALADAVVEVEEVEETDPLRGRCEYNVVLIDPAALEGYDPETDEGEAPAPTPRPPGPVLPTPQITAVTLLETGVTAMVLIELIDTGRPELMYVVRSRVADGDWIDEQPIEAFPAGSGMALQVPGLAASAALEIAVASSLSGGQSGWSDSFAVDASAAALGPDSPTDFAAVAAGGDVEIAWRNPTSANLHHLIVFRGATLDFDDAVDVSSEQYPTGLLAMQTFTDVGPGAGPHVYWVVAYTMSLVASPPAGPVTVEVAPARLIEGGDYRLTEAGDRRLLES